MTEVMIQPRIIRAGQAPAYCGMGREVFNKEIRPYLTEIPIGDIGKGFDRLDLDRALDEYISRRGRAPAQKWSEVTCRKVGTVSASEAGHGTSRSELTDGGFAKALERAIG